MCSLLLIYIPNPDWNLIRYAAYTMMPYLRCNAIRLLLRCSVRQPKGKNRVTPHQKSISLFHFPARNVRI